MLSRAQILILMQQAVTIAQNGSRSVDPNPMVGAVIFDSKGTILSEGWHAAYGADHAEIVALKKLDFKASGFSMAVSLEPCNHYGKTPPCSKAILASGIKNIYYAASDPCSHACGGAEFLRQNGVSATILPEFTAKVREDNRFFFTAMEKNRPWLTLKIATSSDGFIAPEKTGKIYLTGKEALTEVHLQRSRYMGIAAGAGSINNDNPLLNVRYVKGQNPRPVIFSSQLSVLTDRHIIKPDTIIVTSVTDPARHTPYIGKGCDILVVPDHPFLVSALSLLWEKYHLHSLYVEPGAHLFTSCIQQNLFDEIIHFTSPAALGKGISLFSDGRTAHIQDIAGLVLKETRVFGNDIMRVYRASAGDSDIPGI